MSDYGAPVSDYGAPSSVCACDRTFGPHKEKEKVRAWCAVRTECYQRTAGQAVWLQWLPNIRVRTTRRLLQLRGPCTLLQPALHLQEDIQHQGEGEGQEAVLLLLLQAVTVPSPPPALPWEGLYLSVISQNVKRKQSGLGRVFWQYFLVFSIQFTCNLTAKCQLMNIGAKLP